MSARSETIVVYAAGLAQGLALVTFPAASAIFTSPDAYGLSSRQYGAMFLPQAIAAVLASWLGAEWSRRQSVKQVYLSGIAADFLSMALLYGSRFLFSDHASAYAMLLAATTCLGVGFGLTVPALNTITDALNPGKGDAALLLLNALLGIGTAMAPLLISLFTRYASWSLLPLLVAVWLAILWIISVPMRGLEAGQASQSSASRPSLPARFWLFGAFALLYGVIETVNGNWATLYMQNTVSAAASLSSLALTMFWLTVTLGRLLFAAITQWLPPTTTYRGLPLVCAAALWFVASLAKGDGVQGIAAFSLAGFGCSALLPLTISFAQQQMAAIQNAVAGAMIGFYQIGYGIAAFGVGSLAQNESLSLSLLFRVAAGVALLLTMLAFGVTAKPQRTLAAKSSA